MPAIATTPDLEAAARLFHALSDGTRLAILEMLRSGERCVCDLQAELDAAQSRLSFHLRVLREAGLVTDRRDGRWACCAIVPEALAAAPVRGAARRATEGAAASCGGPVNSCCGRTSLDGLVDPITSNRYVAGETTGSPTAAVLASLGCGNPTALAELREGEVVLDLGSGGGIDVLLSARRVGASGTA